MATIETQPATSRAKKASIAAALAVAIIAPAEGLRQRVYLDPVGIPTFCFGETSNPKWERTYPIEECKALLNGRALEFVSTVDRCAPGLPPEVLAAFASAAYNMGPTIACNVKNSTAARLLLDGKYIAACDQLPRWDKARVAGVLITLPGLTKRRAAERDLCLKGANA